MSNIKKCICVFLIIIFAVSGLTVSAKNNLDINNVLEDTAQYLYKTVMNPQVGSIGGEWAVLGLARSGNDVPEEYYQNYYKNYLKFQKLNG